MNCCRIIVAVGIVFLLVSTAAAKSPEERISALEQHLAALQRTYTTNNSDTASTVESVRTMQEEFNTVKGQAEAASHMVRSQNEELMRLIQDLQQRVAAIEERMGVFSTQVSTAIGKGNPQAGAEAEQYQRALDMAQSGRYLEAAGELESFLQKFPKSSYAPNARAWVAECFYMSRDYKRAIKEFQLFVEKYPKDAKVPDAVFKQGNSFYELGMLDEARAFYEKVIQSSPNSKEAQQARSRLGRIDEKKKGGATAPQGSVPPQANAVPAQEPPAASSFGSYPTETIEQQRARMGGQPIPQPQAAQEKAKKPGRAMKEF